MPAVLLCWHCTLGREAGPQLRQAVEVKHTAQLKLPLSQAVWFGTWQRARIVRQRCKEGSAAMLVGMVAHCKMLPWAMASEITVPVVVMVAAAAAAAAAVAVAGTLRLLLAAAAAAARAMHAQLWQHLVQRLRLPVQAAKAMW